MDDIEITVKLIRDIINGKMNLTKTEKKIAELEAEYGKDFFEDYDIEKKEKPWDEKYLRELEIKSMAGMNSKQFILHLAEVSEYVHSNKSRKRKTSSKRKIILYIIAGIIAIVAVAAGIFAVSKNKSAQNARDAAKKFAEPAVKIVLEIRPANAKKQDVKNNAAAINAVISADSLKAVNMPDISVMKGES